MKGFNPELVRGEVEACKRPSPHRHHCNRPKGHKGSHVYATENGTYAIWDKELSWDAESDAWQAQVTRVVKTTKWEHV